MFNYIKLATNSGFVLELIMINHFSISSSAVTPDKSLFQLTRSLLPPYALSHISSWAHYGSSKAKDSKYI